MGGRSAETKAVLLMSEVAGTEDQVPDQAQHTDLLHLAQVHAGDAGQRQGGHQHFQGVAHDPLDRRDGGDIGSAGG